jgi:hypothetical protein
VVGLIVWLVARRSPPPPGGPTGQPPAAPTMPVPGASGDGNASVWERTEHTYVQSPSVPPETPSTTYSAPGYIPPGVPEAPPLPPTAPPAPPAPNAPPYYRPTTNPGRPTAYDSGHAQPAGWPGPSPDDGETPPPDTQP